MGYGNDCFRKEEIRYLAIFAKRYCKVLAVARLQPSDLYHKASGLRQDAAKYGHSAGAERLQNNIAKK